MGFLSNKLIRKKEIAKTNGLDVDLALFEPFTLLQEEQLDTFTHELTRESDSFWDRVYEKTGNKSLINCTASTFPYKMKRGFDEYTYLAALEALLCGMFPCEDSMPCSLLEYGQVKFFDKDGFVVECLKSLPKYERNYSRCQDGSYSLDAGIIQILYRSPIGNFIIKQNQLNNRIFELYVSKDISEMLLDRCTEALEKALDIKPKSMAESFREKYKTEIGSPSPSINLQGQLGTPIQSIEGR